MKAIRIVDWQGRDATVWLRRLSSRDTVRFADMRGQPVRQVRRIKHTGSRHLLVGDPAEVSRRLAVANPEIDMELAGRLTGGTDLIYETAAGATVYLPHWEEARLDEDGQEVARRMYQPRSANLVPDHPPVWSNTYVMIAEAVKEMAFTRVYQVVHTNNLEFAFLYDLAQHLEQRAAMVQIGSGPKGIGSLVLRRGGTPHRGFLAGKTHEDSMCLTLHLAAEPLRGRP